MMELQEINKFYKVIFIVIISFIVKFMLFMLQIRKFLREAISGNRVFPTKLILKFNY